uniref:Uncharacterized protein n=1 Tax=Strigamia maritima TaxID=126957 RepID=T1IQG0_STRMM
MQGNAKTQTVIAQDVFENQSSKSQTFGARPKESFNGMCKLREAEMKRKTEENDGKNGAWVILYFKHINKIVSFYIPSFSL